MMTTSQFMTRSYYGRTPDGNPGAQMREKEVHE